MRAERFSANVRRICVAVSLCVGFFTAPGPLTARTSVRLGGLGTGWIEVLDDGAFGRACPVPAGGMVCEAPPGSFSAVWARAGDRQCARVLARTSAFGLPACSRAEGRAAFPFVRVSYTEPDLPVQVSLTCFSPLQLGDTGGSALPILLLIMRVENLARAEADVAAAVSWQPWLGSPTNEGRSVALRAIPARGGAVGLRFDGPPLADTKPEDLRLHNFRGSHAIVGEVRSSEVEWSVTTWDAASRPTWWDRFASEGRVGEGVSQAPAEAAMPAGCVALRTRLRPGAVRDLAFAISWHQTRFYDSAMMPWRPVAALQYRDAEHLAVFGLEQRHALLAFAEEWQTWLQQSEMGARMIERLATDLEEAVVQTLLGFPDDHQSRPPLVFQSLDEAGKPLTLRARQRRQGPLLAVFPALDARELASRIPGADAHDAGNDEPLGAWLRMTSKHASRCGAAAWLSDVWNGLRDRVLAWLDAERRDREALTACLDLAATLNDTTVAEQCQALLRSPEQPTWLLETAADAWTEWYRLLGVSMDTRLGVLSIEPAQLDGVQRLDGPVFGGGYVGHVTAKWGGGRVEVRWRLMRVLTLAQPGGDRAGRMTETRSVESLQTLRVSTGQLLRTPKALLTHNRLPVGSQCVLDGGVASIRLDAPLRLYPGDVLTIVLEDEEKSPAHEP